MQQPPFAILFVEDHPLIRKIMTMLLGDLPEVTEVMVAATATEAFELLNKHSFQMAMLDVRLKNSKLDGHDICSHIQARFKHITIAIFSEYDSVACIAKARRLGAHAFISKNCDYPEILAFVQRVANNRHKEFWLGEAPPQQSRELTFDEIDKFELTQQLTNRERELACKLIKGSKPAEAREEMKISKNTYYQYVKNIVRKLRLNSIRHIHHFIDYFKGR